MDTIKDELLPVELDKIKLAEKAEDIAHQIVEEDNLDNIKNLTQLFNIAQAKKNALRILRLNGLLDHVSDQMISRFEKRPDQFSHQDLLNYMQVTQTAIERAQKSLDLMDEMPAVVINQQTNNQVNINVADTLSREERENVMNAIKKVLEKSKEISDTTVYEINEVETSENNLENRTEE